jgi:hypothetical protein
MGWMTMRGSAVQAYDAEKTVDAADGAAANATAVPVRPHRRCIVGSVVRSLWKKERSKGRLIEGTRRAMQETHADEHAVPHNCQVPDVPFFSALVDRSPPLPHCRFCSHAA